MGPYYTCVFDPLLQLFLGVTRANTMQGRSKIALQTESISALAGVSPCRNFVARHAIAAGSIGHDSQAFGHAIGLYRPSYPTQAGYPYRSYPGQHLTSMPAVLFQGDASVDHHPRFDSARVNIEFQQFAL